MLGLGGLLGLAGCGFRPLYAPVTAEDGGSADIRDELAAVRVANIPERSGQLLRRDLQRRTITRLRYIATGNWALATLSVPPRQIAASAIPPRALDSFNIPDLQFFAADSARDAMEARLVDELAETIFRRVALELRRERQQRLAAAPG